MAQLIRPGGITVFKKLSMSVNIHRAFQIFQHLQNTPGMVMMMVAQDNAPD